MLHNHCDLYRGALDANTDDGVRKIEKTNLLKGVKDRLGVARGYAEGSAVRRKAIKVAGAEAG